MEDLLFYFVEGLVDAGKVVRVNGKVAGEDALQIVMECSEGHYIKSFVLLRSELNVIREVYKDREPYMCYSEIADFCKLFNAMP